VNCIEGGRARIVNVSQGPEYGDASACLKITYSGDPARPVEYMFKMRAPSNSPDLRGNRDCELRGRHLQEAVSTC
jgi:hypothetical protein